MANLLAVRAPTASELLAVLERTWDAGDAVLPVAADAPDAAVTELLAAARPAAFAQPHADRAYGTKVSHLPQAVALPEDAALVVATSGTTGAPTPVVLTHAALRASVTASLHRLACAPGTPWLVCLPVHHVAGITAWLRSRASGVEAIVHDRFDVDAVAAVLDDVRPWVSLVPTQLARLLDAGVDVSRFAGILLGGAAAPPGLAARASDAGAHVVTSYGMTETCGGCVYDGVPLDGVEVGSDGAGRLRIRGPVTAAGVIDAGRFRDARSDGWITTSDVGRVDAEGRVQVDGRADDVIVSGGENIPTAAVAATLAEHPAIDDVAVVGRPDPEWGMLAVAAVVVAADREPPTLAELRQHVGQRHPRAWAPRRIVVVEEVPRTSLGKPNRRRLAELVDEAAR